MPNVLRNYRNDDQSEFTDQSDSTRQSELFDQLKRIVKATSPPDPYEILKLGGSWVGLRFPWRNSKADVELRLEVFLKWSRHLFQYAQDCIFRAYPQFAQDDPNDIRYPWSETIINHQECVGFYCVIHNATTGVCRLNAHVDPSKTDLAAVYSTLCYVQQLMREKPEIKTIELEIDLPNCAVPPEQPGLKVKRDILYNYTISCQVATELPNPRPVVDFESYTAEEQKRHEQEFLELADEYEPNTVCFALRDQGNRFLGMALLERVPNLTNTCELDIIHVDPELRGTGNGAALLKLVEEVARRLGFTRLIVSTMHYMVPSFYRKHNYSEIHSGEYNGALAYTFCKTFPRKPGAPVPEPKLISPFSNRKLRYM